MAKINRVEELPNWFDIENYRECEFFSAAEWFVCLSIRMEIIQYFKIIKHKERSISEYFKNSEASMRQLDSLRRMPLTSASEAGKGKLWDSNGYKQEILIKPVRDMKFSDLVTQFQDDLDGVKDGEYDEFQANRWGLIVASENSCPRELNDLPVGNLILGGEPVLVDLNATDSVLITAFSSWLKEARAKQPANITSKRERPTYKDWARYGLLPYLDLMIWAMETEKQIPHHIMAEAVGYRKGGDSFRKTVPKLADNLMDDLSELQALAAIEAVG